MKLAICFSTECLATRLNLKKLLTSIFPQISFQFFYYACFSKDPLLQRLSIGDLRLNPLQRKSSKGQINNHRNNAPIYGDSGRGFQEMASVGKKNSFEGFNNNNNQDHVLHAPEVLQPVRRFAKSRNDSRLEDNSLLDMKMNTLSPEPLRPIPSFKSKSEFEHGGGGGDYRYKSSFKDGFL